MFTSKLALSQASMSLNTDFSGKTLYNYGAISISSNLKPEKLSSSMGKHYPASCCFSEGEVCLQNTKHVLMQKLFL